VALHGVREGERADSIELANGMRDSKERCRTCEQSEALYTTAMIGNHGRSKTDQNMRMRWNHLRVWPGRPWALHGDGTNLIRDEHNLQGLVEQQVPHSLHQEIARSTDH
jgi:hypothetical protein